MIPTASMTYHRQTFARLMQDQRFNTTLPAAALFRTSMEHYRSTSQLPEAVLEWCVLKQLLGWTWGEQERDILSFYSNDDHYWLRPDLRWRTQELPVFGAQQHPIISFGAENQNNGAYGLLLDGSANPPVMYTDYRKERWVQHVASFSDFVYTKIFDWQFKLKGRPGGRNKEIGYHQTLRVRNDPLILERLNRYQPEPRSFFFWEATDYEVRRYSVSPHQRLVVFVNTVGGTCQPG